MTTSDLERVILLASVDCEYRFGQPKSYLAPHELARLTIVRSKLGDTRAERAAEHLEAADLNSADSLE
jgi:hypothetical protein